MIPVLAPLLAATGVALLLGGLVPQLRSPAVRRALRRDRSRPTLDQWLAQAGLDGAPLAQLAVLVLGACAAGSTVGALAFGAVVPAVAVGVGVALAPVAVARRRRAARRHRAADHWPRLIDEIRVLTASAGRSIPQALFEAAQRTPPDLRPAFDAAQREWLLTTDLGRSLAVLKNRLADPTADVVAETLLIAHLVGGADLDRRLAALADDRRLDLQCRKDARARQAGVRFARLFVLAVPAGMALAGMSVGTGRAAYATTAGQAAVLVGLGVLLACWAWSGRLLRLPDEQRVFPT